MTAYVRRIGNKVCFTFPGGGGFTFYEVDEVPENIMDEVNENGHYEGDIPDGMYWGYLVCEAE